MTKKKYPVYARTKDGRVWVQQTYCIPFMYVITGGIPMMKMSKRKGEPSYIEIDVAVAWLEKEAAKDSYNRATLLNRAKGLREKKAEQMQEAKP